MAYTKYSLTPANNNAAPPDGAPEGMLPSAVNDTMRDMMAQIRDAGDGIRGGTYTMTAPVITGGSITGVALSGNTLTNPVITGGSINNTPIGASTANTGAFTNLAYTGTLTGGTGIVNLGSSQFYKDASGNVGIGTSSPSYRLDVRGDAVFGTGSGTAGVRINGSNSGTGGGSQLSFGGAGSYVNAIGYSSAILGSAYDPSFLLYSGGGPIVLGTASDIIFSNNGRTSEFMRITSAGNVGIGTSSPSGKLSVTTSGQTLIQAAISNVAQLSIGNGGSSTNYYDANTQIFRAGDGAERMRIDSSGNLLVGTTSAVGKTTVESASNVQPALFLNNSGSSGIANPVISIRKFDNNTTTSQVFVQFTVNNGSTGCGQINANGGSAAAFGSFSDARLKENIENLPSQLENITALRPVEFDYKTGGHQIGFIAQEMQEVYPDVVGEGSDGMLMITGWSKTEARLVKAIQEQQALIENLTTRLNALEGK